MHTRQRTPGSHRTAALVMLGGTGVVAAVLLLVQIAVLVLRGATSDAWWLYVALMAAVTLAAGALFALVALGKVSPPTAVCVYAWAGYLAVAGFLAADYTTERDTLPWIVTVLPAAVSVLAVVCGARAVVPFYGASAALVCIAGCLYRQVGDAVAMLAVLCLVVIPSLEIRRLRVENERQDEELNELQLAIRTVANNGRKPSP